MVVLERARKTTVKAEVTEAQGGGSKYWAQVM